MVLADQVGLVIADVFDGEMDPTSDEVVGLVAFGNRHDGSKPLEIAAVLECFREDGELAGVPLEWGRQAEFLAPFVIELLERLLARDHLGVKFGEVGMALIFAGEKVVNALP